VVKLLSIECIGSSPVAYFMPLAGTPVTYRLSPSESASKNGAVGTVRLTATKCAIMRRERNRDVVRSDKRNG